jgi:hypothetical protein
METTQTPSPKEGSEMREQRTDAERELISAAAEASERFGDDELEQRARDSQALTREHGDAYYREMDTAAAKLRDNPFEDEPVASLSGIGTEYRIFPEPWNDGEFYDIRYRLAVASGPASRVLGTYRSFRAACIAAIGRIEREMEEEEVAR